MDKPRYFLTKDRKLQNINIKRYIENKDKKLDFYINNGNFSIEGSSYTIDGMEGIVRRGHAIEFTEEQFTLFLITNDFDVLKQKTTVS